MKLPNCEQAVVARAKITEYLLSPIHRRGGSKAAFFLRFGFTVDRWEMFAEALRGHACAYDVASVTPTAYGRLYRIEGAIDTPDGRGPRVRSVWMVDTGADVPRLISAYPAEARSME